MAETFPPPPPTEAVTYRPLSGLAVAGFGLAVVFGIVVLFGGTLAWFRGNPFLLPSFLLVLPLAGAILSLLGQGQIRHSEGTRAGMELARWGLAVAVLSGMGYFVYAWFTGLALTQQAHAFLMEEGEDSGFFPLLHKSGADAAARRAAFLLTLPATSRGSIRPEDEAAMIQAFDRPSMEGKAGHLSNFLRNPLVEFFGVGPAGPKGGEVDIAPLAVQNWTFENGSYQVNRTYRLSNREMTVEALLPVQSTEGVQEGERRRWFLALPKAQLLDRLPTELGRTLATLRTDARKFTESFITGCNAGMPWKDFPAIDDTSWTKVAPAVHLPEAFRNRVYTHFAADTRNRLRFGFGDPGLSPWRSVDRKLEVTLPFEFMLPLASGAPEYVLLGHVVVRTKEALDPNHPPRPLRTEWEIRSIVFERVNASLEAKGPGRGG